MSVLPEKSLEEQLNQAVDERKFTRALELLEEGADPNTINPRTNLYPLQVVAKLGDEKMVAAFLYYRADPNLRSQDPTGGTAVHYAMMPHNKSGPATDEARCAILRMFAAKNAKMDVPDKMGFTPLTFAARNHMCRSARTLIGLGADPGKFHMHEVSGAARELSEHYGVKVPKSINPTHITASLGIPEMMDIMAWAGGSLTLKNSEQKTPIDIVLKRPHDTLKERMKHFQNPKLYQELVPQRPLTHQSVAEPVSGELTMLDHPAIWHESARLFADLEAQGQRLTKEEILRPRAEANSWLGMAISCRALAPLLTHLAKHGEALEAKDFYSPVDGQLREEFQWMADYQDLPKLVAHWEQSLPSRTALVHNLSHLPPEARDYLPIHQLLSNARRAASIEQARSKTR